MRRLTLPFFALALAALSPDIAAAADAKTAPAAKSKAAKAKAAAKAPQATATEPIKNFRLPTFTDEGFRRMVVTADEASLPDPAKIDLKEMEITLFDGLASEQIDSMLAAPTATPFPDKQFALGKDSVRLERSDLTVTGKDWTFDHPTQKVVINRDAHVIFHTPIGDILK